MKPEKDLFSETFSENPPGIRKNFPKAKKATLAAS
jgi:hypothetical protein